MRIEGNVSMFEPNPSAKLHVNCDSEIRKAVADWEQARIEKLWSEAAREAAKIARRGLSRVLGHITSASVSSIKAGIRQTAGQLASLRASRLGLQHHLAAESHHRAASGLPAGAGYARKQSLKDAGSLHRKASDAFMNASSAAMSGDWKGAKEHFKTAKAHAKIAHAASARAGTSHYYKTFQKR